MTSVYITKLNEEYDKLLALTHAEAKAHLVELCSAQSSAYRRLGVLTDAMKAAKSYDSRLAWIRERVDARFRDSSRAIRVFQNDCKKMGYLDLAY